MSSINASRSIRPIAGESLGAVIAFAVASGLIIGLVACQRIESRSPGWDPQGDGPNFPQTSLKAPRLSEIDPSRDAGLLLG
jgi:hypothetical protein